jgi:hypothetical protein
MLFRSIENIHHINAQFHVRGVLVIRPQGVMGFHSQQVQRALGIVLDALKVGVRVQTDGCFAELFKYVLPESLNELDCDIICIFPVSQRVL